MLDKMYNKFMVIQRGAIIVFFALLLPLILGFMGFGIDLSLAYVQKGKLQDIADAAALAGAAHLGEEANEINGDDNVGKAVRAFVEANGLPLEDGELRKMEQTESAWEALGELGDDEKLRVAYGVVNVNDWDRVRVRIDKRVPIFFLKALLPDLNKGLDVRAVAAAEGNTGDEPVFRIIGRNGVYDHFFNLSGSKSEGEPDKWIDGSVYAGNMLRASYKQNKPYEARNMFSVNGYIFADMLNTGLPLRYGVSGDKDNPSDDRIYRREYIRRKNGKEVLTGFDALTETNYTAPGWNGTAKDLAERKLQENSMYLKQVIDDGTKKRNARMKIGKNRYICNRDIKNSLTDGVDVVDLKIDRKGWENEKDSLTNHQYSNIGKYDKEIDTLYVEIQGDRKDRYLPDGREGAVWVGVYEHGDEIYKIKEIIVELHQDPDLTGTCIINLGRGAEIGPIYSQANLVIRAPYTNREGNGRTYLDFTGPIFSDKTLSFSYDDLYFGTGIANHHFGKDTVLYADLVLFGYGYEIGRNMLDVRNNSVQTYHYDNFTNYRTEIENEPLEENWWNNGIGTVDYLNKNNEKFKMEGWDFHDKKYCEQHKGAVNEIDNLNMLWNAIDHRETIYEEFHNGKINIKGFLYGDFGRWPTERETNIGHDKKSNIIIAPFAEREGAETITTRLRLVE